MFTATIGALQVFTEPLVFLGRSLREEGITIVAYLYRDAFMNNFFGTASATAVMLFILIMVITCVNLLLTNQIGRSKWKGDQSEENAIIWKDHVVCHVNHCFVAGGFPFYWMFVMATNPSHLINQTPPVVIPGTELVRNFQNVMANVDFLAHLKIRLLSRFPLRLERCFYALSLALHLPSSIFHGKSFGLLRSS